ncbi:MAG: hypothetical protein H7Y31_11515 [Chitinophagaceae bacterium]|nr:hypothetical protein [Chitinophagaceae bacterium]
MKKISALLAVIGFCIFLIAARRDSNPYGFKQGNAGIQSISAIAFGTDGILFIGDSKSASVFAIDTKDKVPVEKGTAFEMKNIDQKIAAVLGTEAKNIRIQDIAVNPVSKKVYCAVQSADGTPVLLTIDGQKIEALNLRDISFSSMSIANAPATDAKDRGGRPLRDQMISDLNFSDGSVLVSGLSNQEFSSTFRRIPFPFTDKQDHASLEIFHAAHGKYETASPIRTFTTASLNGKKYLVASYTCTPLVLFPLDDLKAGKHVKGRTVAEFGAGNSPLDIITMQKEGNTYLVMSNSNRPVMRVDVKNIEGFAGTLTDPIKESYGTAGVAFTNLPVVNVLQMDKMDDTQVLVLQRKGNGDLDLYVNRADRWL